MFHPDDPLFAMFRQRMELEQGTLARKPKARRQQNSLPMWLLDRLEPPRPEIEPLSSNALALRFDTLKPGPELALRRPEREDAEAELFEPPSVLERRLRIRLGEMVSQQAVEDGAGAAGVSGRVAGAGLSHRYNAVLKRVSHNKSRAQMSLAELEAALSWLERNRLADHLHLLDGDPRYAWSARQRDGWKRPVGRVRREHERRA
ncbi:hypothetical protein [Rhizosaccharibacter radicis]|uniref:Uncharacterized protein n=1 Tax=Rhizosaccharibacter radicis TaxID=2782605 RepID=A0ABT1W0U1_9PROT|nr:hypothetical protein [Acetobacteraceae bacterium KSS12]